MQVAEVVVTALVTPESSEKIVEVLKTFQYTFLSSSSIPPKPRSKILMQCCFCKWFFCKVKIILCNLFTEKYVKCAEVERNI
jgi:hypothetical protein